MSTALVKIAPRTVEEAKQFSVLAAESTMLPQVLRNRPADVFAILLTGMELGLGPMQALRSIHIIQGRPVMAAELLIGLAKRHPDCLFFQMVHSDDSKAVYKTQRRGDPEPTTLEYSFEQAKKAGLTGKDNWRNNPAAMLRARAGSALARAVYPDAILGLYAAEEMGEGVSERLVTEGAVDADVEEQTSDVPREVAFPVADEQSDERERLLQEEKAAKQKNADELHAVVNAVLPGDINKDRRKAEYKNRFGLSGANPIKTFLGLSVEEQSALLMKAYAWKDSLESDLPEGLR